VDSVLALDFAPQPNLLLPSIQGRLTCLGIFQFGSAIVLPNPTSQMLADVFLAFFKILKF
jgi:hypothetical protein